MGENKKIKKLITEYWKAYTEFLPKEKHIQSKKETFTVEGYHSLIRHFLARLRHRTKCYTKSIEMLKYSMMLLMTKWNNQICILTLTMPCAVDTGYQGIAKLHANL